MSIEICWKCCDPETWVDTDYNAEDIYWHGFDWNFKDRTIKWTGKEDDVTALCFSCLHTELERNDIDEEWYRDTYY